MTERIREVAYSIADLTLQYDPGYCRGKFDNALEGQAYFISEMQHDSDETIQLLETIAGLLEIEGPVGDYDSITVQEMLDVVSGYAGRSGTSHVR